MMLAVGPNASDENHTRVRLHYVYQEWVCNNSSVFQSVRPRAAPFASYAGVDKIIKTLLVFHARTFGMTEPSILQEIIST